MGADEVDLTASHTPMIVGVNSMFIALAFVAVLLRFHARKITGAGIWVGVA